MIHPEAVLRLAALLTPLCLILSACVTAKATSAPACGDFLDKQGDKPAYIEYQGCHSEYEGQGKPLVARYRLDGTHAAKRGLPAPALRHPAFALCVLRLGVDAAFLGG
ncbi:DUF4952 domain-containing protein [Achromobacter xylosoxidans]